MRFDVRLIAILLAVVLLSAVGSAYITSWVFTNRSAAPAAGQGVAAAAEPEYDSDLVWDAGSFTVDLLSSSTFPTYVKTGISVQVSERRGLEELERRRVQVRDRIIAVLRTTTPEDLKSEQGHERLKQRLRDEVGRLIVGAGARVVDVYFSELVVQ